MIHETPDKITVLPCSDCNRMHKDEQPCPRRIARVVTFPITTNWNTLQPQERAIALGFLDTPGYVEDLVEEHLADTLA